MKTKNIVTIVIWLVVIFSGYYYFSKKQPVTVPAAGQCKIKEITFYYLDGCGWCQKVKSEGTISKLEELGVKVTKINAAIGPIRHQFEGVPTFVIDDKVYSGYKTFDELKELLSCQINNGQDLKTQKQAPSLAQTNKQFLGAKGEKVVLENEEIQLNAPEFDDNKARFYNTEMPGGKIIHFFVVKDRKGVYRAAADACQVCYGERKGFRQEGDEIVCNNCGNRYPIEKIATEKGGCNPGPINPNLEVKDGKLIIKQSEIEKVSDLF